MNKISDPRPKQFTLYLLKLEHSKYYVGITTYTAEERMQQHIDGVRPANWTREHKPLELLVKTNLGIITEDEAKAIENKATRKYIKEYGLDNVRGGDITEVDDYTARFNRIFPNKDWEAVTIVILLLTIIIALSIYVISIHK
jgi:predicted GIY-YIG superfamily endonuclease